MYIVSVIDQSFTVVSTFKATGIEIIQELKRLFPLAIIHHIGAYISIVNGDREYKAILTLVTSIREL